MNLEPIDLIAKLESSLAIDYSRIFGEYVILDYMLLNVFGNDFITWYILHYFEFKTN